ncbi:hypothetical protein IYX23_19740 [Methylocystis sp. L43]|uniref:hypothetical protein n=1 Tax=unclassified Methylocystis TaxID=2625913 RepID=UPI0018C2ABB8|nr:MULTISPECIES: hypothetical protein [unclassified Methylocystis]MBG0799897.1 hypothetical protein [Methylocystis sp. L43]MBG0807681.1 hypothetical protein [Methylocystis sp. H15]
MTIVPGSTDDGKTTISRVALIDGKSAATTLERECDAPPLATTIELSSRSV